MNQRGPLFFSIALLLLPLLYVGSYFALVVPGGIPLVVTTAPGTTVNLGSDTYRANCDWWACRVYWPLEKIDRTMRPAAWERPNDIYFWRG